MDIYESYKPLRNYLRSFEFPNSFYVIWAYSNNLENNKPFPNDVIPIPNFAENDLIQKTRWVTPWKLVFLCKEIIINSDPLTAPKKTLANPELFYRAIEKINDIQGFIAKKYINVNNVLKEMHRISHQQFPWQINGLGSGSFARYHKIYSDPKLDEIIKNVIGLSVKDIYLIGVVLWGFYQEKAALSFPVTIEVPEIKQEGIEKFLKFFSRSTQELKPILESEQQMDEKFFYTFSSIQQFPLLSTKIDLQDFLYCPFPNLFFQQMLSGAYYAIWNEKGFDNAFGDSFQTYVGEVINTAKINKTSYVYPEEQYGQPIKQTVDWILEDSGALLFIECKTKRLTLAAKIELLSDEEMNKNIQKLAESICQVYKTIEDYKKGLYPSLKYNPKKAIFPLVVTLEDWFIFGENETLNKKILELLGKEGIKTEIVEEMPYSVCSVQELETLVQIVKNVPISEVFLNKLNDQDKKRWVYATYLHKQYPDIKIKPLFPNELNKILPERFHKVNHDTT